MNLCFCTKIQLMGEVCQAGLSSVMSIDSIRNYDSREQFVGGREVGPDDQCRAAMGGSLGIVANPH
jgi:hypothetical protein